MKILLILALPLMLLSCESPTRSSSFKKADKGSPSTSETNLEGSHNFYLDPRIEIDDTHREILITGHSGANYKLSKPDGSEKVSECSLNFEQNEILTYQLLDTETLILTKNGIDMEFTRVHHLPEDEVDTIYGKWRFSANSENSMKVILLDIRLDSPVMFADLHCTEWSH